MGLFTLHSCCALCSLDYLKPLLESKSRHPIAEFSGYHCNKNEKNKTLIDLSPLAIQMLLYVLLKSPAGPGEVNVTGIHQVAGSLDSPLRRNLSYNSSHGQIDCQVQ